MYEKAKNSNTNNKIRLPNLKKKYLVQPVHQQEGDDPEHDVGDADVAGVPQTGVGEDSRDAGGHGSVDSWQ